MKKVDDLISLIDQSSALGLPFGSHFFPNRAEPSTDALCRGADGKPVVMDHTAYTKALSRWFGCVLLIGLGGPFWFNAFSSLPAVILLARGRADEKAAGGACGADQSPPPAFKPA